MKNILFGSFFLYMMILLGCSPTRDYYEELSGNYFYRDEGQETKEIISHGPNLNAPYLKDIYGTVIDYDDNSDFIIAIQHPNFEDYKIMVAFNLRDDTVKYPGSGINDEKSLPVADSILKHDPYFQKIFAHKVNYWIIVHKDKRLYGPLTKAEFLQKRKELDVPESLKIKME